MRCDFPCNAMHLRRVLSPWRHSSRALSYKVAKSSLSEIMAKGCIATHASHTCSICPAPIPCNFFCFVKTKNAFRMQWKPTGFFLQMLMTSR